MITSCHCFISLHHFSTLFFIVALDDLTASSYYIISIHYFTTLFH